MPSLDETLQQKLRLLAARGLARAPVPTVREGGVRVLRGGKPLISFSCNDALGLSRHPEVAAAARDALEKYGAGAGASRLVTGDCPLYEELEAALAQHKNTQAACVFGSGYLANIGTIPALLGAGDLILADKFSHACILDAARISGATLMRFAHNNMEHCRMLLAANRAEHQNCLIVTETVFSMEGDRAPLGVLSALAREFDAWLMTDDAHGLGIAETGIRYPSSFIQLGTLSKAAGSYGGYVCGTDTLVGYLKSAARSLVFSTALPPATLAASLAALRVMAREPSLAQKALAHARLFTSLLDLPEAQSHIVPVIVKENEKALIAAKLLEEHGYLVAAIRPPTVPENTARLRFAFSALHAEKDIRAVADIIRKGGMLCAS